MKREDAAALLERSTVRAVFGAGALDRLGDRAHLEGARRTLLVTDPGVASAGHVARAFESLAKAGVHATVFDGARENPTTEHVAAGVAAARADGSVDFIIGVGGGSAMDCAKGVNLILSNGGRIQDYWGVDKPTRPLLPSILVPTTAGTGSEAQSFALITDPHTKRKMACGDRRSAAQGGLRPRVAILDPALTRTQPRSVAAATGIDAITHAVETAGTRVRNDESMACSRAAWRLLSENLAPALENPNDGDARTAMLLGAHLAGAAIERSMLGAAHACANPLTARFGITHGVAVGLMAPHVVRFNAAEGVNPYAAVDEDPERLARRLEELLEAVGLPRRLSDCGVSEAALTGLAEMAAEQWTAGFNPRPVGREELEAIYRRAL